MNDRYHYSSSFRHSGNDSELPLFERIDNNEYVEAQRNREFIKSLQHRLEDLEKINIDLEYRLEDQAKLCIDLEHECSEIERGWKERCDLMEREIKEWKKKYSIEEKKGDRLREQISRTEKELYGILQRKYELMRVPGGVPFQKSGASSSRERYYDDMNAINQQVTK